MTSEVFQVRASQSQLTVEWLAYLVSSLPSLSILAHAISPLQKSLSHILNIFSISARVVDMWLHKKSCTDETHTPKIKVSVLYTHAHCVSNSTKALMIGVVSRWEWRAWPSRFLALFPTVSTTVTGTKTLNFSVFSYKVCGIFCLLSNNLPFSRHNLKR